MKKFGLIFFVLSFFIFTSFQYGEAKRKNYYRTFEIIGINEQGLILQDSDANVIQIDRDPGNFKVGYKVRYDSVRKRLRAYRWQDYEIIALEDDSITLQHKTGDILAIKNNYAGKYAIGALVRYDSVNNKLQPAADSGQWRQYTVIAASSTNLTLESNNGQQIIVNMNNNLYPERRGVYIGKYKVGDLVRYNASSNKLKKGVIRTYDWQEYEVKVVTDAKLILINKNKEELVLENTYDSQFKAGDPVKYDRLNDLLKKLR
jgi:hypothetical protein